MKGYIIRKNDHWYVVIYEGLDPATGKERFEPVTSGL